MFGEFYFGQTYFADAEESEEEDVVVPPPEPEVYRGGYIAVFGRVTLPQLSLRFETQSVSSKANALINLPRSSIAYHGGRLSTNNKAVVEIKGTETVLYSEPMGARAIGGLILERTNFILDTERIDRTGDLEMENLLLVLSNLV